MDSLNRYLTTCIDSCRVQQYSRVQLTGKLVWIIWPEKVRSTCIDWFPSAMVFLSAKDLRTKWYVVQDTGNKNRILEQATVTGYYEQGTLTD